MLMPIQDKVQYLFFSLLKSALWGKNEELEIDNLSHNDIVSIIKIAKSQGVLGHIAHELITRKEFSNILSDDTRKRLTIIVQETISRHIGLNSILLNVVSELRNNGINPVLLKGQGISMYYPIPELRQCGDIDIYVDQENFSKSCEIVSAMSSPEDHLEDLASIKHFHTRIGPALIEIHRYTDVYSTRRYDLKYQKISDAGMHSDLVALNFSNIEILTPSVDFNAFYIFNHFWHHFISEGVVLRQLCDWVRLLHVNYGKINLNYLSHVLKELQLMKQWKTFGYIAVNNLGLPANEMPFYEDSLKKKSSKLLDLIIKEGSHNVDKQSQRPKGYLAGKLYTFSKCTIRDISIFQIFPIKAIEHISKVLIAGIRLLIKEKFHCS